MKYKLNTLFSFIKKHNEQIIDLFIIILLLCFVYFYINGYVKISYVFSSIFYIMILFIYKYVLMSYISISKWDYDNNVVDSNKNIEKLLSFFSKIIKNNYEIFYKYPFLLNIIYYIMYYFPTNWLYLFIMWLGRKWWDIRLFINSNKDIFFKFYGKDFTKWNSSNNYICIKFYDYIIVPIFRIFLIFLYFKVKLIEIEWNKLFRLRFLAMLYTIFLVVNNMHLYILFKTTDLVSLELKIFIVFLFVYFFLLIFFERLVKSKHWFFITNWNDIYALVKYISLHKYYDVRHYLIFMVLCDKFSLIVNKFYGLYFDKIGINGYYNNIEFLIKIGRFRQEIAYAPFLQNAKVQISNDEARVDISQNYGITNNITFDRYIEQIIFKSSQKVNLSESIWMFEKNYLVSMSLFVNINYKYKNFQKIYTDRIRHYKLYTLLYGEECIQSIFGTEFCELKEYAELLCFLFNYLIYIYKIKNEIFEKDKLYLAVPYNYINNSDYNQLLNIYSSIFNINYVCYSLTALPMMELRYLNREEYLFDILDGLAEIMNIDSYKSFLLKLEQKHKISDIKLIENLYNFDQQTKSYFKDFYKINQLKFDEFIKIHKNDVHQQIINKINLFKIKYEYKSIHKLKTIEVDFYKNYNMKSEWQIYKKI